MADGVVGPVLCPRRNASSASRSTPAADPPTAWPLFRHPSCPACG